MKRAESVTFGGSGFDRATELRRDDTKINDLLTSGAARIVVIWRGKPLMRGENGDQLATLAFDHPVLGLATAPPVFLGLDGHDAVFAQDISAWPGPDGPNSALSGMFDPTEQHHPDMPADTKFVALRMNMGRVSPRDAELAVMAVGVFAWHRTHGFCANCGAATRMELAGWQRSCPDCARQHFPRTDPVVIMLITNGNSVLVGRSPGWPEGMYSLLAGFMEPGETVEAAVRREVFEETAVRVGSVGYLASQPWPFPSSLMIGCQGVAETTKITMDPKEIEDATWVTREEILDAWANRSATMYAARKGSIANFLIRNWLSDTLD